MALSSRRTTSTCLKYLPDGMKYHGFFHYSFDKKDRDWVQNVTAELEDEGFKCRHAENANDVNRVCNSSLECSLNVLVVLSRVFNADNVSQKIMRRYILPKMNQIRIIPIALNGAEIPPELNMLVPVEVKGDKIVWIHRIIQALNQSIEPNVEYLTYPQVSQSCDIRFKRLPFGKKYHVLFHYCISNDNDKSRVSVMVEDLEKYGFLCCLYDRDFIPGEYRSKSFMKYFDESLNVCIFISPYFLKDTFSQYYMEMYLNQHLEHDTNHRFIPILAYGDQIPYQLNMIVPLEITDSEEKLRWWPKILDSLEDSIGNYSDIPILANGAQIPYQLNMIVPLEITDSEEKLKRLPKIIDSLEDRIGNDSDSLNVNELSSRFILVTKDSVNKLYETDFFVNLTANYRESKKRYMDSLCYTDSLCSLAEFKPNPPPNLFELGDVNPSPRGNYIRSDVLIGRYLYSITPR